VNYNKKLVANSLGTSNVFKQPFKITMHREKVWFIMFIDSSFLSTKFGSSCYNSSSKLFIFNTAQMVQSTSLFKGTRTRDFWLLVFSSFWFPQGPDGWVTAILNFNEHWH